MRYIMKEKLLSWGDDFVIRDEQERDCFLVDGKVFTFGNQLAFQDMAGNELAYIKQRLFAWGPTYEIYREGNLYATINKELFTFFHCTFTVDVPGPNDLKAEGDFFDHEYTINRNGQTIALISKQWFSWTNTYGVEIADGEDDLIILASTVVIDQVCHEERK